MDANGCQAQCTWHDHIRSRIKIWFANPNLRSKSTADLRISILHGYRRVPTNHFIAYGQFIYRSLLVSRHVVQSRPRRLLWCATSLTHDDVSWKTSQHYWTFWEAKSLAMWFSRTEGVMIMWHAFFQRLFCCDTEQISVLNSAILPDMPEPKGIG